jgi:hypothetical protein
MGSTGTSSTIQQQVWQEVTHRDSRRFDKIAENRFNLAEIITSFVLRNSVMAKYQEQYDYEESDYEERDYEERDYDEERDYEERENYFSYYYDKQEFYRLYEEEVSMEEKRDMFWDEEYCNDWGDDWSTNDFDYDREPELTKSASKLH